MAKRISVLNGTNKNQDYDFLQFQTSQLIQGVAEESDLEIQPQAVPDNTVIVKNGIANITIARVADSKVFNIFGEFTADENLTIPDTGTNPTWVCAIVAVMLKSKIEDGTANAEDGTGIFDVITVAGTSVSALSDGDINTALSATYYWIRLADVVQDPTVASGDITDKRIVIGVKRVTLPNNSAIRGLNSAGTAYLDVIKMAAGGYPEFTIVPRNPSGRTISSDLQLIDRKYFNDNLPVTPPITTQKDEATAVDGELFENTDDDDNLAWKNNASVVERVSNSKATTVIGMFPGLVTGEGTGNMGNNTTALIGMINIPNTITATKLSLLNVSGSTTYDIVLYAEDGQSQILAITTATISGSGLKTTSFSATKIPAGNYYIAIVGNGGGGGWQTYTTSATLASGVTSKPVLSAILTVIAGELPATISPSGLSHVASKVLIARFD